LETLASALKIEIFQLLIPPETKAALSVDSVNTLRKLIEIKKAYDDRFNEVLYPAE
jgi:hypothetical protein